MALGQRLLAATGLLAILLLQLLQTAEVAAAPPTFSAPTFGSAASGSWLVNVSAPLYQSGSCREPHAGAGEAATALRVLMPSAGALATTIVLALPVEDCGTETARYGSAIDLIRKSGWLAAHPNVAIATPAFSTTVRPKP